MFLALFNDWLITPYIIYSKGSLNIQVISMDDKTLQERAKRAKEEIDREYKKAMQKLERGKK